MSENKSDVKTFLYIGFNLLVMYLDFDCGTEGIWENG